MAEPKDYLDTTLPQEVQVPLFPGLRYQAQVPDTLDLAERAMLAINAMTRCVNPAMDYRIYFWVHYCAQPPLLVHHQVSDDPIAAKFLEALPLCRWASGNTDNAEMDGKMMSRFLHITGKDGLWYTPYHYGWHSSEPYLDLYRSPFAFVSTEGRCLLTLATWHQHDGNPLWLEMGRKKIDRIHNLGIWDDAHDGFHLGRSVFLPGEAGPAYTKPGEPLPGGSWEPETGIAFLHLQAFVGHGAMLLYRVSGYEPALDMVRGMTHHFLTRGKAIAEDGRYVTHHFHLSTYALITTLDYALVTGDQALIEFVKRGYEYGKAYGDELIGFFPEVMPIPPGIVSWEVHRQRAGSPIGNTCESCEVADMIVLALKMSRARLGDYWDDVDRYVRNQFVEQQVMRTDWIETALQPQLETPEGQEWLRQAQAQFMVNDKPDPVLTTTEDAAERSIGSFAGWAAPNDFVPSFRQSTIMHCCTGNGARALVYAWDSIVTADNEDRVRVNLLLNRASPWLDVDSHLPYEGRVDLRVKTASAVRVRLPSGTEHGGVHCRVNGADRSVGWDDNYVVLDGLKPGDTATVTFPQQERTVFRYIGENMYRLTLKGNTVVDIDPEGTIYPLYQRDHYRAGQAPLKQVTRFVSDETFLW